MCGGDVRVRDRVRVGGAVTPFGALSPAGSGRRRYVCCVSPPWRHPFEAALQQNAPRTEVQVATVTPEGMPAVRTVLLRGLGIEGDPYFFTDARSRKADHLRENPRLALMAWFANSREQFRLSGPATLHGRLAEGEWAELRQRTWSALSPNARQRYLGAPPGQTLVTLEERPVPPFPPQEFLIVSLEVTDADWLVDRRPATRVGYRKLGAGWVEQALTP